MGMCPQLKAQSKCREGGIWPADIHIGTSGQKSLYDGQVRLTARTRRPHYCIIAFIVDRILFHPPEQKDGENPVQAQLSGQMKKRTPTGIQGLNICSADHQLLRQKLLALQNCLVKNRTLVFRVRKFDVRASMNENPRHSLVAAACCLVLRRPERGSSR